MSYRASGSLLRDRSQPLSSRSPEEPSRAAPMPRIDHATRPFGLPDDVVVDLPIPPSVNRTRRVDWAAKSRMDAWARQADMGVMVRRQLQKVLGPVELRIVVSDRYRGDLDNICKSAIDYLRRIEVIQNDSPKYLRKFTVEFGPCEGCRVTVVSRETAL